MLVIDLTDFKGDYWRLIYTGSNQRYLHNGSVYWKSWWYAPVRPHELRDYDEIPLPIFTAWFA